VDDDIPMLGPPTGTPVRSIYLKLDGIPGDSVAARHAHEIELFAYSFGVRSDVITGLEGAASAGRAVRSGFRFLTRTGRAAPLLFLAVANGRHLTNAVLSVESTGPKPNLLLDVTLEGVLVTGYEAYTATRDELPLDLVSLHYDKITLTDHPQTRTGSIEPAISAGWNFRSNSSV
jgi:type VI secretion system secreted protein Hcp